MVNINMFLHKYLKILSDVLNQPIFEVTKKQRSGNQFKKLSLYLLFFMKALAIELIPFISSKKYFSVQK